MCSFVGSRSGTAGYTVTVGQFTFGGAGSYINGFTATYGSVSPSIFYNSGTSINGIYWSYNATLGSTNFYFTINGNFPQNTFSSLIVAGQTFSSGVATYTSGGGSTTWQWSAPVNPFPTVGAQVAVTIS